MGIESMRKRIMAQDGLGQTWINKDPEPPKSASDSAATSTPPTPPPPPPPLEADANAPAPADMSISDSDLVSSADWTEDKLVNCSTNFSRVRRISASVSEDVLLAAIKEHEDSGDPLVVEGWHMHPRWDDELFTVNGFIGDGEQIVDARNVRTAEDVKMTMRELMQNYQSTSKTAEPGEKQRFYGKDIECPAPWSQWLKSNVLPPHIHPLGDGDMFSHLPVQDRPETLMCYLGTGDTFTPAHKDLCGSFGHNLMCHTADGGSAFWFMTATGTSHMDEPAMYFQDKLGSELDLESHTITIPELKAAPFHVYVTEQRLGDLVLVPPRSCHQVVNHGGVTIKMSWSRMGLKSFQLSLYNELPLYHRVCRQEIYRVKLNIFYAVQAYGQRLSDLKASVTESSSSAKMLQTETESLLKSLLHLLDDILVQEWHPNHYELLHRDGSELHSCDFCGADIFQSFFMCKKCKGDEDTSEYVCCPACYLEGRSCACEGSHMVPSQSRRFDELLVARNKAAKVLDYQPLKDRALNSSQYLHLFEVACKLQVHKKTSLGGMVRRCTTRSETDPPHDALATSVLRCNGCHSSMCFRHILNMHGIYVADAILAYEKDNDQVAWHALHIRSAKRKVHPSSECEGDLTKRMKWIASKFRRCRPIDQIRSKEGFYDDFKLVGSIEEDVGESQVFEHTPGLVSSTSASADRESIFDGALSELSDDDMDVDSYSDSSRSSYFSPTPKRRSIVLKSPKQRSRVSNAKDGTVVNKPVSSASGTRPSGQKAFVLVPPSPKKRPIAKDVTTSTSPMKKAKFITPRQTAMSASSLSKASDVPTTIPNTTTTPSRTFRERPTVVPIAIPVSTHNIHKSVVAKFPRGESTSGARLDKLPDDARFGPPRQNKNHRSFPSPSSNRSTRRPPPVPATPFTGSNKSSDSTGRVTVNTDVTGSLHARCDEDLRDMRERLHQSRAQEGLLRCQMQHIKKQSSVLTASANRDQINKLEAERNDLLRQIEETKWQTDETISELTDEISQLRQTLGKQKEEIVSLREEVRTARAEQDENMGKIVTIAGAFGRGFASGIGPGVMQPVIGNAQVKQQPYSAVAVPSSGGLRTQPYMHGVLPTQPASERFIKPGMRGGGMRSRGSRGGGRGFGLRWHSSNWSRQNYANGREIDYPARGRNTQWNEHRRQRSSSPRRKVVYERDRDDRSAFRDDGSESRTCFDDAESSIRAPFTRTAHSRHGDGGWNNLRSGAPSNYQPSNQSVSRSRSPGSPVTPPRSPYTISEWPETSEVLDSTPANEHDSEALPVSLSNRLPIDDQAPSADVARFSRGEESVAGPSTAEESENRNTDDQDHSNWEHQVNPWVNA